jgi:Protein of unknown function (DUF2934)
MPRKTTATSEKPATRAKAPSTNAPVKRHKKAAPPVASETAATEERSRSVAYEDVARLAFSYWEQRGYQHGSPDTDWLRAEQELQSPHR